MVLEFCFNSVALLPQTETLRRGRGWDCKGHQHHCLLCAFDWKTSLVYSYGKCTLGLGLPSESDHEACTRDDHHTATPSYSPAESVHTLTLFSLVGIYWYFIQNHHELSTKICFPLKLRGLYEHIQHRCDVFINLFYISVNGFSFFLPYLCIASFVYCHWVTLNSVCDFHEIKHAIDSGVFCRLGMCDLNNLPKMVGMAFLFPLREKTWIN